MRKMELLDQMERKNIWWQQFTLVQRKMETRSEIEKHPESVSHDKSI